MPFPTFDARPDRADYRDREYEPRLRNLPHRFPNDVLISRLLPVYERFELVRNQEAEGACTGFGLAALIQYLFFREAIQKHLQNSSEPLPEPSIRISARMLYEMARKYDEWEGESYDGSSCQGALKGWHHHGVCQEEYWPYVNGDPNTKKQNWDLDAPRRPLGSYFRVDVKSLSDMQAAICEAGAVFGSCRVHNGWGIVPKQTETIHKSLIPFQTDLIGAHAFAIIGYTRRGFIIQNSWGPTWGYHGFCVITYRDWVRHAMDAWVASLGAPMVVAASDAELLSAIDLDMRCTQPLITRLAAVGESTADKAKESAAGWAENRVRRATVVLGDGGSLLSQRMGVNGLESNERGAFADGPRLVLIATDGFSCFEPSLADLGRVGQAFEEAKMTARFVSWQAGIGAVLQDRLAQREASRSALQVKLDFSQEAKDRAVESYCRTALVKALWTELTHNCASAAKRNGAIRRLVRYAVKLGKKLDQRIELHLVGHSAGALLVGHLVSLLRKHKDTVDIASVTLLAPACTAEFAMRHFAKAVKERRLLKNRFYLQMLSDQLEQHDNYAGLYGKSLLYLVSRALDEVHKTALIGLERVTFEKPDEMKWHRSQLRSIQQWQKFVKPLRNNCLVYPEKDASRAEFPTSHLEFLNSPRVIERTIQCICRRS